MITTITGKNQITLPADIVRELDLRQGTQIDWSVKNGVLVGQRRITRAELAKKLAGRGRKYLRAGSDPIRDLIKEREKEA